MPFARRQSTLRDLEYLKAGAPSSPHHISRAPAARKGHHEIRLAFIKHALVADRASLAAKPFPIGHVDIAWDALPLGPLCCKGVRATGAAGNHQADRSLAMDGRKSLGKHSVVRELTAAADKDAHLL